MSNDFFSTTLTMKKRLGARNLSRKVPDSEQVLVTTVCRCKLKDLKTVEVYPVEKGMDDEPCCFIIEVVETSGSAADRCDYSSL